MINYLNYKVDLFYMRARTCFFTNKTSRFVCSDFWQYNYYMLVTYVVSEYNRVFEFIRREKVVELQQLRQQSQTDAATTTRGPHTWAIQAMRRRLTTLEHPAGCPGANLTLYLANSAFT